ncbi:DUF881 domain-containing protein, partial [Streptomyces lonarensis]
SDAPGPAAPAPRAAPAGEEAASPAPRRPSWARGPEPGEAPAVPDTPAGEAEPAPPTGRDALVSGLWPPRFTRAQLIVAALLFVLGLGLAVQIRAAGEDGALRGARPEDLVRILSDLDERTKRLDEERGTLERQRTELESSSDQADEARRQNRERELQLGVLAGTVAATGPGIEVRISDPQQAVGADRLLDAVQELRAAGAEALQINGVRVVASTSFVDDADRVLVDGEPVERPFRVDVIGRPQDLEPALNIPGGVVQSLDKEGATVTVNRPEEVVVDALRSAEPPDYAQSSS